MNVVLFVNWTAKRFAFPEDENAMWDGQPFSIQPGEKKWLEDFKAQKLSVDIAQRELNRENKPLNKDLIDSYAARCFAERIELGQSVSPAEAIAEQISEQEEAKTEEIIQEVDRLKSKKPSKAKAPKVEEEFEGLNE